MRSAYIAVTFRSWQIVMTVMPFSLATSRSILMTSIWYFTSRLAVGSSRSIILGSCAKLLAIITFWC